jgi:hypothetical protein
MDQYGNASALAKRKANCPGLYDCVGCGEWI